MYDNIRFAELGQLLEVDNAQAEKIAARMIGEGRLKGCMDQVDGILTFESDADAVLQGWDEKIRYVFFLSHPPTHHFKSFIHPPTHPPTSSIHPSTYLFLSSTYLSISPTHPPTFLLYSAACQGVNTILEEASKAYPELLSAGGE